MDNYKREFKFENGTLTIRLSGVFPNELLDRPGNMFQPLLDACKKEKCNKVLVDARALKVNLGTFELFHAGENTVELTRKGIRVAFVISKETFDDFFETVSINRGSAHSTFFDIDTAFEWIEKK